MTQAKAIAAYQQDILHSLGRAEQSLRQVRLYGESQPFDDAELAAAREVWQRGAVMLIKLADLPLLDLPLLEALSALGDALDDTEALLA